MSVATSSSPAHRLPHSIFIPNKNRPFSLVRCLESGQAFAWHPWEGSWIGTFRQTAFALRQNHNTLEFRSSGPSPADSKQLEHYFALDENPRAVRSHFPMDPFLQESLRFGAGLRILRQDPWECLAGFILSSTKKILHIQQIWRTMSERWGEGLSLGNEWPTVWTFPEPDRVARLAEADLRTCRMGFRAPYLLAAARKVSEGRLNLEALRSMPVEEARIRLMELKGVGRKIADCVLLFSLGKSEAFPVDTWILKVLRQIYFRNHRQVTRKKLMHFASGHFGRYGGHAQQYLFHYARMNPVRIQARPRKVPRLGLAH